MSTTRTMLSGRSGQGRVLGQPVGPSRQVEVEHREDHPHATAARGTTNAGTFAAVRPTRMAEDVSVPQDWMVRGVQRARILRSSNLESLIYNHINNPTMLIWLAEATVNEGIRSVLHGSPKCIRRRFPRPLSLRRSTGKLLCSLLPHISERTPSSRRIEVHDSEQTFGRGCSHRPR